MRCAVACSITPCLILRAAESLCAIYPFLNRDLVTAGVILHDLDKVNELEVSESGTASGTIPPTGSSRASGGRRRGA